jgi:phage-related protein
MDNFNSYYTTPPSFSSGGGERYRPQIKTNKDANYIQTRPAVTRSRNINMNLKWDKILVAEYNSIASFFDSHQGNAFLWTEPYGATMTVCFSNDSINWKWTEPYGNMEVSLTLEEY